MSHTPEQPDYGHTTSFYQGQEAGINEERKRVVKLIQDHAPDLDTLRLIALIESNQPDTFEYVTDKEHYEQGLSDAGEVIFAVLDRLKHSVYDLEELTHADTSREQHLIRLILERYTDGIWEKRDSHKYKEA